MNHSLAVNVAGALIVAIVLGLVREMRRLYRALRLAGEVNVRLTSLARNIAEVLGDILEQLEAFRAELAELRHRVDDHETSHHPVRRVK